MASTHKRILRSVAFVAIFCNYLQSFEGLLMIIYSFLMLNQWNNQVPSPPPPPAIFQFDDVLESLQLPSPWFIYSFMVFGIALCGVGLTGCYAASTRKRCNICFHEFLVLILLSTEAVIVSYLRVDEQWDKILRSIACCWIIVGNPPHTPALTRNLPFDPTGQLDTIRTFMETHAATCRKIGFYTILIQVMSMVLGISLRILMFLWDISLQENDNGEVSVTTAQQQILDPNLNDIWSVLVKEKNGQKYTLLVQNKEGKKYEV